MYSKKIKVLHFIPGFDYGGIESIFISWIKYLDIGQFDFQLLTQNFDHSNTNILFLIEKGIKINKISKLTIKSSLNYIYEIFKLIRNEKYDIIHCHIPTSGFIVILIAYILGVKVRILHSHTNNFNLKEKNKFIKKIFMSFSVRLSNSFIAVSDKSANWLFNEQIIKSKKYKLLTNGIDYDIFKYNEKMRNKIRFKLSLTNSFVICHVGRFSYPKNHDFLLEVFKKTREFIDNAILILIGSGELENHIKDKIFEMNLNDHVVFLGNINNVNEYLSAMDLFLMPSHFEGFPVAVIEAQANGLDCIVSDNVTSKVDFTMNILHLPINKNDIFDWVNAVISAKSKIRTKNDFSMLKRHGLDIQSTVKNLEQFYYSLLS